MVAQRNFERGHDLTLPPPVYEIHYAPPEYDTPDARHKLEYDLYYAKNYTPFLDLLILIQTLRVILWPEGAR